MPEEGEKSNGCGKGYRKYILELENVFLPFEVTDDATNETNTTEDYREDIPNLFIASFRHWHLKDLSETKIIKFIENQ